MHMDHILLMHDLGTLKGAIFIFIIWLESVQLGVINQSPWVVIL